MFIVKQPGIDGTLRSWIEDWLSNRKQSSYQWHCLRLDSSHQWSPTGFCFRTSPVIIYINDIDVELNNFTAKFADDTKQGNSVITDYDRMSFQEDLRKISE